MRKSYGIYVCVLGWFCSDCSWALRDFNSGSFCNMSEEGMKTVVARWRSSWWRDDIFCLFFL